MNDKIIDCIIIILITIAVGCNLISIATLSHRIDNLEDMLSLQNEQIVYLEKQLDK